MNPTPRIFDVAVLGAGSGGEAAATALARGSATRRPMNVVVFEPGLVGGECPFLACIPSKVLLARAQAQKPDWQSAIARRDTVTDSRDDTRHAKELRESGVTLVRSRATITGPGRVASDGVEYTVDHIIVATGSAPKKLHGIEYPDDLWDSSDALSSAELPTSLVIIGGGPIGCELSEVYARFGTTVTIVEAAPVLLKDVEPEISNAMERHLEGLGVNVLRAAELTAINVAEDGYVVQVKGLLAITCSRVLVAIGKTPRLDAVGLETLGLDPANTTVDDTGRLGGVDRVWAVGDVTAIAPYTHGANAQASVVVDNIAGAERSMRAAVMPRCVYTHPPVAAVGPTISTAADRDALAVVRVSYADIARPTTDELGDGQLTVFAERESGIVIGASGFGRSMDEVIGQITFAIETRWPVSRLQHVVQPFPTISQLVGLAFEQLASQLETPPGTIEKLGVHR